MEIRHDESLDSPSKNSYIGSYYQPPDRILSVSTHQEFPAFSPLNMNQTTSRLTQTTRNIDSRAVVDALRTLQEKIRRLELERRQAEKSYFQFSQDTHKRQQDSASHSRTEANEPRTELDLKLQSAETRCKVLEKQLDYMRKMVENVMKERNVLMENEASLQRQQPSTSNNQNNQEKLEKLEFEYLKLLRTQTIAEMKLSVLEQKLLKEEHERKLVQEKADELQRELDVNLNLPVPPPEETRPKKKTKKTNKKTSKQNEVASGSLRHKKMPYVIGTSTSPSHSVHANVQSILHMMKQHQPKLYERVCALQRSGCRVKKNLHNDFSDGVPKPESPPADQSLTLLSDLLLALQDELGQMSFDYQELEHQIEAIEDPEQREDLQRELERLTVKMEEKGAQITKLRKHQQTVHKRCLEDQTFRKMSGIKPPAPSPVKAKQKAGRKGAGSQKNLQLLRQTQKFRKSLKQDDVSWET